MGLELVTPATNDLDLISLADAKLHIRVDQPIEDDYVTKLITAAREHVEDYLQRTILEASWRYQIDRFPIGIIPQINTIAISGSNQSFNLPRPIATGVSSFTYFDSDNIEQALVEDTDFIFHPYGLIKSFVEPIGLWPTTFDRKNAVTIEFDAGWIETKVPFKIRQAILIVIGDMYEQRQSDVFGMSVNATKAMEKLCSAWRVDQ